MSKIITRLLLAWLLLTPVSVALAYIGPGAGISVLGSLLSILATFFVAIGAIVFWPLRKWLKRRKARREPAVGAAPVHDSANIPGDDGPGNDAPGDRHRL
jgi:membrane protein implicated in regulation of membrane protease activity